MKKRSKFSIKRIAAVAIASIMIILSVAIGASAEAMDVDQPTEVYEENIFAEMYSLVEGNADKIFSVLAFIGTVIVGVGYKSGLLPLLNDALSKLKGAIDGIRENEEKIVKKTSESISDICDSLTQMEDEIRSIEQRIADYGEGERERAAMRVILENQVNMLYALFITSSLPQYQKDEIGEMIGRMREELASCDKKHE